MGTQALDRMHHDVTRPKGSMVVVVTLKSKMAASCASSGGNKKRSVVFDVSEGSNKYPEPLLDRPATSEHLSAFLPFKFPASGKYNAILDSCDISDWPPYDLIQLRLATIFRYRDNACYLPNAFYKLRESLFLLVYGASKFVFPPIVFSTFALLVKKSYAMNYAFRIDRISCVSRKVFAHLAWRTYMWRSGSRRSRCLSSYLT